MYDPLDLYQYYFCSWATMYTKRYDWILQHKSQFSNVHPRILFVPKTCIPLNSFNTISRTSTILTLKVEFRCIRKIDSVQLKHSLLGLEWPHNFQHIISYKCIRIEYNGSWNYRYPWALCTNSHPQTCIRLWTTAYNEHLRSMHSYPVKPSRRQRRESSVSRAGIWNGNGSYCRNHCLYGLLGGPEIPNHQMHRPRCLWRRCVSSFNQWPWKRPGYALHGVFSIQW